MCRRGVAERLIASVLKCLQLTSISPRKYHLSTRSQPIDPYRDITYYGTTAGGGVNGNGTVFSVTTTGAERVRYSFDSGADGAYPYAGLINVNGTLYGTTLQGGGSGCSHNAGCGSIFAFTP
jgi:uncharacterized repeat protein (TIGR03803 family)